MADDKRFDTEQIQGSEFMDDQDRQYFDKFGSAMDDQAGALAEQYDIDPKEANEVFDFLMDTLLYNEKEYIVNGAPLKCSMQADENSKQTLFYHGNIITSKPVQTYEMSALQLPEEREEDVNGLVFANVSDTIGGLRGELLTKGSKLNITSFGNCKFLSENSLIQVEDLADKIYRALVNSRGYNGTTKEEVISGILEALKLNKGTCYCCMVLNSEWENLPVEYDYMDHSFHPELPMAGISKALFSESYMKFGGREGINMMSMLFCQYGGGIISAKESGQGNIYCYDGELVFLTATGAKLITDLSLNPQGIPLYSGRTMNGNYVFFSLAKYPTAQYSKACITTDKTRLEGSLYKYIHPSGWQINLPVSFNKDYHGNFTSNGNTFSIADNRIEIACRRGISTCDGESFDTTLAGKYVDVVLSDGTVLACIMGGSKGDEPGSDPTGVVHHDGSIIELLETGGQEDNADKDDILHGCDMVGAYVYSEKRLYDPATGEYTYYFSEGIDN